MRHVSVISGHTISTGFCGLTGCQQDPRDRGVTLVNLLGYCLFLLYVLFLFLHLY